VSCHASISYICVRLVHLIKFIGKMIYWPQLGACIALLALFSLKRSNVISWVLSFLCFII
jgi:hypothetical protein